MPKTVIVPPFEEVFSHREKVRLVVDISRLLESSQELSNFLSENHVAHIAFAEKNYVFVRDHLSFPWPLHYYIIAEDLALWDTQFMEKWQNKSYYKDSHTQAVLVPFDSLFNI